MRQSLYIIVTVIVCWWLFAPYERHGSERYCTSHESFLFACHHNESDTDTYLRRIVTKLDRILEQIDKTPIETREMEQLEKDTFVARVAVSCTLKQLQLLKTGKVATGFIAWITPNILRNHESTEFDRLDDVKMHLPAEVLYYTNDESKRLELNTIGRNLRCSKDEYRNMCLSTIKMNLYDVIKHCLAHYGIKSYLDITSYDSKRLDKLNNDEAVIIKAISNGNITNLDQLDAFIFEHYKQKETKPTTD